MKILRTAAFNYYINAVKVLRSPESSYIINIISVNKQTGFIVQILAKQIVRTSNQQLRRTYNKVVEVHT